jgi:signal transduction histidine kinase
VFFHTPHQDQTLINVEKGVVGNNLSALIPDDVMSEFDKAIEQNKNGEIVEVDCFSERTEKWFSVKLSPIFEDICYRGSLAVSRDISERKNQEMLMESAKLEAEEANLVKGRFLATVSHEIRTPLNAIVGIYYLLSNTKLDENQKDFLNQLHASSRLMGNIIDDILDFSKAEAGTLKFESVDFDLFQLINQLTKTFQREIDNKQIEFVVDIDKAIPSQLTGYKLRLTQVLNNLLSNAVKFTARHGHISLKVVIEEQTEAEHLLNFTVIDDGIGIPEAEIENLFEPFTQVDNKYSRQYGGTGLGLAISQNLVNVMGGRISCASEPGKGTCFSFTIPLAHQQLSLLETNIEDENSKLADVNVLVVDDDELNRLIVCELIREHVASVTEAASGQEALELCRENDFSIILMDVQMPEMDGYEATYHIRKNRECAHLPIIAVTAHAAREDHERSLEAGMNDHLSKPINPEQLLGMLIKWS